MKEKSFQLSPSSKINRVRKRTPEEERIDRENKLEESESLDEIKDVYAKFKISSGGLAELMADKVALETFKIEAMSAVFGEAYLGWMVDPEERLRLMNRIINLVKEFENPTTPLVGQTTERPGKKTIPSWRKEPSKHWLDAFHEREDEKNEANRLANEDNRIKPTNEQK